VTNEAKRQPVVRTVLGDVVADQLGPCDAHEHLIIDRGYVTEQHPDLRLDDVTTAVTELREMYAAGARAIIDTMPCDASRNVGKLVEVSHQSGMHVVAPTGLHLAKYYPPNHWQETITQRALTRVFVDEVENGVKVNSCDDAAASNHSEPPRPCCGVIKVAGSRDTLTDLERRNFDAAAAAYAQTGCPIITHTEKGTAGHEQLDRLEAGGASLAHVVLSHVDRQSEPAYHRELLHRGAVLEYDAAFRWRDDQPNHTLDLLSTLLAEFPHQITVGMDAARRSYWRHYGGSPGLAWLFTELPKRLRDRGIVETLIENLFLHNPARAFAFAPTPMSPRKEALV
jgi:phosphotriesterase-related protein